MGKENDFSVFIKSEHVLYCFFLRGLVQFESIREKSGKIKLTEKLVIQQYFSFQG